MPAIIYIRSSDPKSGGTPLRVTVRRTRIKGVLRSFVLKSGEDARVDIEEGNEVSIIEEMMPGPT